MIVIQMMKDAGRREKPMNAERTGWRAPSERQGRMSASTAKAIQRTARAQETGERVPKTLRVNDEGWRVLAVPGQAAGKAPGTPAAK